jgi:hypothetical protein
MLASTWSTVSRCGGPAAARAGRERGALAAFLAVTGRRFFVAGIGSSMARSGGGSHKDQRPRSRHLWLIRTKSD